MSIRQFQHCRRPSDETREQAEEALLDLLEAPRVRLLRQFNILPDGVKFLVDMRSELLRLCPDYPELKGLERNLGTLGIVV